MELTIHIKSLSEKVLESMGFAVTSIEVSELEPGSYKIELDSPDSPLLIGKHGDTLMALQHIVKAIAKKETQQELTIMIDIGGYREQYEAKLVQIGRSKAERVMKEDIRETLFPMNSYHRRLVHTMIALEFPEIETGSIGEEPNRRITMKKRAQA